jgi:hypothetical protein
MAAALLLFVIFRLTSGRRRPAWRSAADREDRAMSWHKPYNISGTVHCGGRYDGWARVSIGRVEDWCGVLRAVLRTDNVGIVSHFTGAISVFGSSLVASVVSSGFEVHDFWALVPGGRAEWECFASELESGLSCVSIPFALLVHETVQTNE